MEVNKKLVTLGIIFFLVGFVGGVVVGTVFTQEQLDGFSEAQIKSNIEFEFDSVEITEKNVIFKVNYTTLFKRAEGDYIVSLDDFELSFPKNLLNQCITDNNKSFCKQDLLKPVLISTAKDTRQDQLNRIIGWQTTTDLFDENDLLNIVTDEELNQE